MHPKVKWSLIALGLIILLAPTLGAEIVIWAFHGIEGAIASLKTFGDAVIPKS
jgi:hypothetical protein